MGNVSVEEVTKEWGFILSENERVVAAYKLIRNYILFIQSRLIVIDIQGLTGKKVEIQSISYRHITRFSVENAGRFDLDAELKIWIASHPVSIKKHLMEMPTFTRFSTFPQMLFSECKNCKNKDFLEIRHLSLHTVNKKIKMCENIYETSDYYA